MLIVDMRTSEMIKREKHKLERSSSWSALLCSSMSNTADTPFLLMLFSGKHGHALIESLLYQRERNHKLLKYKTLRVEFVFSDSLNA